MSSLNLNPMNLPSTPTSNNQQANVAATTQFLGTPDPGVNVSANVMNLSFPIPRYSQPD
jgi:hypothetical protein